MDLRVAENSGRATYYQLSGDLSLGGIFLLSSLPHRVGTRITLTLEPPDGGDPLEIEGEVVAPQSERVGTRVKFVNLDDETKERIRSIVQGRRRSS